MPGDLQVTGYNMVRLLVFIIIWSSNNGFTCSVCTLRGLAHMHMKY